MLKKQFFISIIQEGFSVVNSLDTVTIYELMELVFGCIQTAKGGSLRRCVGGDWKRMFGFINGDDGHRKEIPVLTFSPSSERVALIKGWRSRETPALVITLRRRNYLVDKMKYLSTDRYTSLFKDHRARAEKEEVYLISRVLCLVFC